MKKILIFHSCLPSYRIDLFNKLAENFNAKIILFGNDNHLKELGFNIEMVESQALIQYEKINKGIYLGNHLISNMYYSVIKKMRPDIIWCQELGVNTITTILLKPFFNYKIIIGCDDSPQMLDNYTIKRRFLRWIEYKFIDMILVTNKTVERKLNLLFPKNIFYYLPIIQNDIRFCNDLDKSTEECLSIIKEYDLTTKKLFLFVGRLETVKSPIMLIKAFHKANLANAVLCYIGTGSLENELIDYKEKENLNNVIIKGKLSGTSLYAWYKAADFLILPSIYEPFGAVVNEALISGCKVIVSDCVGASTLLDNRNGYIFPSQDLDKLIEIMKQCYSEDKKNGINKMNIKFDKMFNDFERKLNTL